jgi:protein KRI1
MASANPAKRVLFDEDSDGSELDEGAELKINEEYAKRFEHNKKREELQRLEEKYGPKNDGYEESDSSSDESEDDDGFLVTEDLDAEISATLQAIKNKDPRIYDKDAVFYKPVEEAIGAEEGRKLATQKPVNLRQYQQEKYERAMKGEEVGGEAGPAPQRTFAQEQIELKDTILTEIKAAAEGQGEEDDEDDTFIKVKDTAVSLTNGVHPSRAAVHNKKLTEVDVKKADTNPDEFLDNFMASKAWIDEGRDWKPFDSDDEGGNSHDLAEEFEQAYNMRFEDPNKSNEVLKSYSRVLTTSKSVRRDDATGRQRRRVLERERKEAEKTERQEERARYRRLKIEEAAEKLEKIKKAAGISGKSLKGEEEWVKLLDDAWDNDKWEEDMQRKFGDAYYAEQDEAPEDSDEGDGDGQLNGDRKRRPKKPKWDDDVDIKDIVPDFEEGDKPNISLSDSEDGGVETTLSRKRPAETESGGEEEAERPSKKRKSVKNQRQERAELKRQKRRELEQIETLVDVKMNLDDPAILTTTSASSGNVARAGEKAASAAGLGSFRYRETSPTTFGLTARDILLAPSDAALNQFLGLKHLAPYRDAEKKRRDKKRLGKKARLREWRRETFGEGYEHSGPTYGFAETGADSGAAAVAVDEAASAQQPGAGEGKKKRKRIKKKRSRGKGNKEAAAEA